MSDGDLSIKRGRVENRGPVRRKFDRSGNGIETIWKERFIYLARRAFKKRQRRKKIGGSGLLLFLQLLLTEFGKWPKCQYKLRTKLIVFSDLLNPSDQSDIFGTESFVHCLNFFEQFIQFFAVFLPVRLFDLFSEFLQIAIG